MIPAALTSTYGRMVGNRRQGWAIFAAMLSLFVAAVAVVYVAESDDDARACTPPALDRRQPGGQGAALRDRLELALFAAVTTAARAARSTPRWSRSAGSAARSRWRR